MIADKTSSVVSGAPVQRLVAGRPTPRGRRCRLDAETSAARRRRVSERRRLGTGAPVPEGNWRFKEMIWLLVLLLVLFAIVGGIAVSKLIFLLLVVALAVAALGAISRSAS
jgi:hypothetical protein